MQLTKGKTLEEILLQIKENKKNIEFIRTGFAGLDGYLEGGFLRKELVVIGAQTGIGKSIFGGHFFHEASKQGFSSAYFSLEISNEMIVSRLLAKGTDFSPTRIMSVPIGALEQDRLDDAEAKLVVYSPFMSFYDDVYVLDQMIKLIKANPYEFVVIDFIQNVITGGEKEYDRLSKIALELQKLAKQQNCCILVLSQLSNFVGRMGEDKFVEYKGSGNIATVCDLGLFVERDKEVPNKNFLYIRKNRRGPSGDRVTIFYDYPGGKLHE